MEKAELEKHLDKNVKIILLDGDVITGVLHKSCEAVFKAEPNVYVLEDRYYCNFVAGGSSHLLSISGIESVKEFD